MLKAEFPSMTVSASGIAEVALSQSSSPASAVLPPGSGLLAQEVKASIQIQYFAAAERGEISRIRAWRIVRGLDQATLALRADMTQPEVSRAERLGQAAKMKGETLKRLARALQVGIDDLL
jgi:DNA-binding Xre family transcriptional regulator